MASLESGEITDTHEREGSFHHRVKGGLGSYITRRFLETGVTVVGASRSISQQDFPVPNFTALAVDLTKAVAVNVLRAAVPG